MHTPAAPASQPRKHPGRWFLAALAIVLVPALCGQSASAQSQTPLSPPAKPGVAEGTAAIRGRVTSLSTGKPLRNVQVRLQVNGLPVRSPAVTDA